MGCTSSKNVDVYASHNKKPLAQSPAQDAHLVALTSSSYGFLRVDPHKKSSTEEPLGVADDDPVKEVYQRMMSVDSSGTQLPQSWSEVNSVLTQLKSQAQHKRSSALTGKVEPETVDISKLLQNVDDAPPRVLAHAETAPPLPAKHKRDLSVIHTLEEVDQLAHSSPATSQEGGTSDTESEEDFLRHSSLQTSRSNGTNTTSNRFSMSSVVTRSDRQSKVPNKASKSLSTFTGDARQVNSTLFDAEFLESFKEAFEQLSAAVPPGKHALSQPQSKATTHNKDNVPLRAADSGEKTEKPGATTHNKDVVPFRAADSGGKPEKPGATTHIVPFRAADSRGKPEEPESETGKLGLPAAAQAADDIVRPLQATKDPNKQQQKEENTAGIVKSKVASWNKQGQEKDGQFVVHQKKPERPPPDYLENFPKKCPPDGENKAVFYSTSLRGIRKTFEDCNTMRNILHSINVELDERDVSMDSQFRQELKDLMDKPVPVPRLFIKGRYIGGVEEVLQAHESGELVKLLHGLPQGNLSKDCDGCGGVRFIPCTDCSGSCKSVGVDGGVVKCPECNENGLVRCPICS